MSTKTKNHVTTTRQDGTASLAEYARHLSAEEKERLFDQLVSTLAPASGNGAPSDDNRRQEDVAIFYRLIEERVKGNGNARRTATLTAEEKERLFDQFVANPTAAVVIRESEEERLRNVALTARYVEEQKKRKYMLPEDRTEMTEAEKDRLFDAITAGRVAVTKDEKRQEGVALFYRYIECENARDYDNMIKLFPAEGFHSKTYFGNDRISAQAHVRMLKGLFRAFPDWFMVIYEIIASDDVACVGLITGRGTQHEEFFGRPPADHQIAIPTLHSIKCQNGQIVEHRHINPFEDIFAAQAMAPLTEDVMAIRAQQGFDSERAQKSYDEALAAGASKEKLTELGALVQHKVRQCQVLLKGTLRRCAMIALPGEYYCEHHMYHGYGVDGIADYDPDRGY